MVNKVEIGTLTQVSNNEHNFLKALNQNFTALQAAINDTLSRSGVVPNQMQEVIDMNGKRIINIGSAIEATDAVTKQDIQDIIDRAETAIAGVSQLVSDAKTALQLYASEYIYPVAQAALDGATAAKTAAEAAKTSAEAARDALILNPSYQTLIANLDKVLTIANNIASINTVATNIANVSTVAGISASVTALAAKVTEIQSLYDNISKLTAIYNDLTNIDTVATNIASVNAVKDAIADITAVSAKLTDIESVADNLTDITAIAGNLTILQAIADDLTTLVAVGNDLTNINAVAANLTSLNAIVANMSEILNASTYASNAAASATNAATWAEGTDAAVTALGGQHSSKGWAEYAASIVTGVKIYGGGFNASTATATLSSSAKIRLGTSESTIVLTNDSTPITGYVSNESIEYVVTDAGTFAGLTLHVNDIVWSSGSAWHMINNSETIVADATESVKGIAMLATSAEATAGTNDSKIMTPAKTAAAITALAPAPADATESVKGIAMLATSSEATTGTDDTKIMTPAKVKAAIQANVPDISTYYSLSNAQRATLLSTGQYDGVDVVHGRIFETDQGKFEQFSKTPAGKTLGTITKDVDVSSSIDLWCDRGLAYGNGTYVLVGAGANKTGFYSTDGGNTWSASNTVAGVSVAYGNGIFVSVGSSQTTFTSPDGITWTSHSSTPTLYRIVFCEDTFFGTENAGGKVYSSTDGYTWTLVFTPTSAEGHAGLAVNGRSIISASNDSKASISTDKGATWTEIDIPAATRAVARGSEENSFILVPYSGTTTYKTTDNGATWTTGTISATYEWCHLAYSPMGFWLGVSGNANYVCFSPDGVNFTASALPSSGDSYNVSQVLIKPNGTDFLILQARPVYNASRYLYKGSVSTTSYTYALTDLSYSKAQADSLLSAKQGVLTAGTNITIDSNNVISAAGGSTPTYNSSTETVEFA